MFNSKDYLKATSLNVKLEDESDLADIYDEEEEDKKDDDDDKKK